ncbi:MAG: ABC transporter permease, partial [Bacilli bacterium]
EELQQVLTPMMMPIVIAFVIAMFGLAKPDTLLIVITSFIPLFAPMIMFMRIGLSDPALWEIALSIGLLIATIIGLAILAGKVYRGGVLMYGKASLKDFGKALSMHKDK